jgi:hypothetical protein|tara:strand:- start:41 stop:340 length:300 start_codon:yes stop_codon:yes gene_type:complete
MSKRSWMQKMWANIPIGEDTRPKDRVKLGISPSTSISTMDFTVITTVKKDYLEILKQDSHFNECLRACGVEDWDGYKEAERMYLEEREEFALDGTEYGL